MSTFSAVPCRDALPPGHPISLLAVLLRARDPVCGSHTTVGADGEATGHFVQAGEGSRVAMVFEVAPDGSVLFL